MIVFLGEAESGMRLGTNAIWGLWFYFHRTKGVNSIFTELKVLMCAQHLTPSLAYHRCSVNVSCLCMGRGHCHAGSDAHGGLREQGLCGSSFYRWNALAASNRKSDS